MKAIAILLLTLSTLNVTAQEVVAIKAGEPAPFSGLLVKEQKFTHYLESEMLIAELKSRLEIQEKLTANIESIYSARLEEAVKPVPWYQSTEFNRWLGFFLGAATTGLVIWGGSEIVKAVK